MRIATLVTLAVILAVAPAAARDLDLLGWVM